MAKIYEKRRSRRQYNRSENARIRWSSQLHLSFVDAVNSLGGQTSEHSDVNIDVALFTYRNLTYDLEFEWSKWQIEYGDYLLNESRSDATGRMSCKETTVRTCPRRRADVTRRDVIEGGNWKERRQRRQATRGERGDGGFEGEEV
ncbi:hypothetical protein MA16_Dca014241 [Dendrobium catenatum]|uniref:Uncharacterized protein n=1 Tax=Dendrobium catenatum TaxID=906689 RepID=A0A2I0VJZ0_9ASPA|nr:hypothetical protein MA16_Dca014241 [Dendrobium catenatum]